MEKLALLCLPVIGALIGWFTNYLAVKMLFRPRRPISILGVTIQGLVPKRQPELAERIGAIVEQEFGLHTQISKILSDEEAMNSFRALLTRKVDAFIAEKRDAFGGLMNVFLNEEKLTQIRDAIVDSVMANIPETMEHAATQLESRIKIKETVTHHIASFDLDKLEEITRRVAHRELKHIEVFGGVLGFAIGLVQMAVVWCFFSG